MVRLLSLLLLREGAGGSVSLLAASRIALPSSSAATIPEPPSTQQLTVLLQQNVRTHFNNTGKIELEGLCVFYRVSAPLCMACVSEGEMPLPSAVHFLSTVQSIILEDPAWSTLLASGNPAEVQQQLETPFSQIIMAENTRTHQTTGKVTELQAQVDQVKTVMSNNVAMMLERGERLESMQERSEQLAATSQAFKTTSRRVQRHMCFQNAKWTIIATVGGAVLILVIILIILSSAGVFSNKGN